MGPAWFFARKNTDPWLLFIYLLVTVGLAVAGRLFGALSLLMILASALALAVLDLSNLDAALRITSIGAQTRQFVNKHIQSLALALGFGFFIVLLERSINLRLPFVLLMLLVAFTLFALDRVWAFIKRTRNRNPADDMPYHDHHLSP